MCTEGKGKVVSCHPIPDKLIAVPPKGFFIKVVLGIRQV